MSFIHLAVAVLALSISTTQACYQHCSATFNHKIQLLVGITDTATLTDRSCQAMSEQMVCLEGKKTTCDSTSLQYVNTILNFIRPDFERTCASTVAASTPNTTQTTGSHTEEQCSQQTQHCSVSFNSSYTPAINQAVPNTTAICESLDYLTMCVEDLIPECGQYIGPAIQTVRGLQQQNSHLCSDSARPQEVTECVNDTMDCFEQFNATFAPARKQYLLVDICSAMDTYSQCLNKVHTRKECHRYTQHALVGLLTLKQQYSMYCGSDGGLQAQTCVTEFQKCYTLFNNTYFPAVHLGNMNGICSSVTRYANCVQPLYKDCGFHMAQALASVRVLKEQFALQCNPEFQRLSSCQPLGTCLRNFGTGFSPGSSSSVCKRVESYFPCVEDGLAQCEIPPEDTSVDFSQLGALTGAYCQRLLGNTVLSTCPDFVSCASGIVLVTTPDPSAMFDADTWCSYMDMSLSCVERAINAKQCGLSNDDTIKGHLNQQRNLKRKICKLASVPPISPDSPNAIPAGDGHHHKTHGHKAGHDGSDASMTAPTVLSLVLATVLSLVFLRHV